MRRLGIAAVAAALALAAPQPAAADPGQPPADFAEITVGDTSLDVVAVDADRKRHDPDALTFHAKPDPTGSTTKTWTIRPDGGDPPPAFDASGIDAATVADGTVRVELADVDGPGELTLSTMDDARTAVVGESGRDTPFALAAGADPEPMAWTVDAPGEYHVTLGFSASTTDGAELDTALRYRIVTVDGTVDEELPGLSAVPLSAKEDDSDEPAPDNETEANGKVITKGHVDMGPRFVDGEWTVQLRDDTGSSPTWRNLSDVVLHVVDDAITEVPEGDEHAFLGDPGDEVWILPQAEKSGIVWPGWNTQDPSVIDEVSGSVTWNLLEVDGPGAFSLFLTGSFGEPEVLFDSSKSLPQDLSIPVNTHAHGNWAFSEAGIYHLKVEFTAETSRGAKVSDTRVLNLAVGDDTDPDTGFGAGTGGTGSGSGDDSPLPTTGVSLPPLLATGAVLIAVGAALAVTAARRGRTAASDPA